jgi:TolB-like protein
VSVVTTSSGDQVKDATRVDETMGREVGSAHGVRALLLPAIRKLGTTYSLEMRAIDPGRDEHLFTLSDRATFKEGLLDLLDRLSERTRTELGEGRGEVERARVQLGEAMTRSVEAYQHYVAGLEGWLRDGQRAVALRELPAALELDPGFAAAHSDLAFLYFAYGRPDLAVPHWREADENADRMPLKERSVLRLRRSFSTPSAESWSRDDALRLAGELSRRFSGDKYVLLDAADAYTAFGMDDLRDGALRKALDLDPGLFVAARALSARLASRTAEALEVARRAVATRRSAANLSLLVEALHASGATEEAAATAREALRLDGGRNSLVVERSCFTLRQGGSAPECAPSGSAWRPVARTPWSATWLPRPWWRTSSCAAACGRGSYQATRAAGERRFAEAADLIQQVQAEATNRNYPGWLFSQSSLTAEMLLAAGRAEEAARVWPVMPACRCRDPVDYAVDYPRLALLRARAMEQLGRRAEAIRQLDGIVAFWKEADDDLPLLVEAKAMRRRLAGAPATARALAVAKAPATTPSIAVLPFADMSPGRDQEYLSDGIAEEILNALSSVEGLRVPGRVSSFYFKGRNVEPAEIARKLGVAHLLNGSVRHSGGRIRVTAEVVRVSSGERLWSQTFERDMADVFAVQDEIARAVVESLKVRLLAGAAYSGPRPTTTTSPEAYSQYLLGQRLYRQGTPDSFRQAVKAFEKAVALDPGYAPAWAAMGIPMFYVGAYATSQEEALAAAEKALALAPDLCDGLSTRGSLRESVRWGWTGGRADLERAVRLCPGSPDGWRRHAIMLSNFGRLDEAIPSAERAAQLDPLGYSNIALARILRAAGKNERSLPVAKRAVEAMPDSNTACGDVAAALLALGRAAESLERFRRCAGGWAFTRHGIVRALWSLGRADEARSLLRKEEEQPSPKWVHIGIAYSWMGDSDKAFEWLNRAVDAHDLLLGDGFLSWPELGPLHTDPRWKALRRRLNLPVD